MINIEAEFEQLGPKLKHENVVRPAGWRGSNCHLKKLQSRRLSVNLLSALLSSLLNHFEITGDLCNLIGSQQCDLFLNRTIFCSKSHLFFIQWEWDCKTKQPIRFKNKQSHCRKMKDKKAIVWQIWKLMLSKQNGWL